MKPTRQLLTLALIAVFAPRVAGAAATRDSIVVSSAWLTQHLKDPNLVLLHVGDKAEYDAAHIPGARFVALQDLHVSDRSGAGLILEMAPADVLRGKLEAFGISDDSKVVVYFGKDWVSPSTRLMFTLDWAGLGDRSALLDGGQPAWTRGGGAVTATPPQVQPGHLSPLKTRPIVASRDDVRARVGKPGYAVLDARNTEFYDGTRTGGGPDRPHRTGHIAGAASLPFNEVADDQMMLLSPSDMAARFTKAGVKPGDTVIAYCHIGQQATAVLFAARSLGFKVELYDGSFEDWSRAADSPVDNPSAPKPVKP